MRAGDQRVGLAAEAFVFGYPLVTGVRHVIRMHEEGVGPIPPAPYNRFAHVDEAPAPMSRLISVNTDALMSVAQLDLRPGPLVLEVPAVGGRYFAISFVDAWTNNIAYVGRRSVGVDGAQVVLVPPGWDGAVPADLLRIDASTRVLTLLGRFAFNGPDDVPAVRTMMRGLRLRPTEPDARQPEGPPERSKQVCDDLRFWEEMRIWMRAFPPSSSEQDYARRFEPLGLLDDASPYVDPDPDLAWSLRNGFAIGRGRLEQLIHAGRALVNGWSAPLHAYDFNIDHLELGTLDDPAWKISDRAQAHIARALATRLMLWGCHAYETSFAHAVADGSGHPLTGAHDYTLRFDPPPPTDAFWSLAMYEAPEYYLVPNELDRYAIGSLTEGLRYDADGSLTIVLSSDRPADPESARNWLPAPSGDFRSTMRIYHPGAAWLDGDYLLPPIVRVA